MKRIFSYILCVILLLSVTPVFANGNLEVELNVSDTDIANIIPITATVTGGNADYVSLWVNNAEIETQKTETDGAYKFEYWYDAVGTYDLRVVASDGTTVAKDEKTVKVGRTVVSKDQVIDFEDYSGGTKFEKVGSANFGGSNDKCTIAPKKFQDGHNNTFFVTIGNELQYHGGPWLGYDRESAGEITISYDVNFNWNKEGTSSKYNPNVKMMGYDTSGAKRVEWTAFEIENGTISGGGQTYETEENCWYNISYTINPTKNTHSLTVTKDDVVVFEYRDVSIAEINSFSYLRFWFKGGKGESYAFDNFASSVSSETPQIIGIAQSESEEPSNSLDYTANAVYVTISKEFAEISENDVSLKNEIGEVKIKETILENGKLKIVPDYKSNQSFESANRYTVTIGENAIVTGTEKLGCKLKYCFDTTAAQTDFKDGAFEQCGKNVNFSAELVNGENVRIILLAFQDGNFVSAKSSQIGVDTLSGEYESGIRLKALAVGDDFRPISNKVYQYIVK